MRSPGVHHTGLTVSDLESSIAFYRLLGFEVTVRIDEEGEEVERGTGVPGSALTVAMMERPGARLELIQYVTPDSGPAPHPNNGIGAAHVCLEVEDIDEAVEELSAEGVEFLSEPIYHESGIRWVYCRDPDGITAELLQILE
ncbi:MAG TPA: VOC family protein [Thermoleophilaceae bacterium]|nr:VOC family protein [Thermoleophilaceae bacterium]